MPGSLLTGFPVPSLDWVTTFVEELQSTNFFTTRKRSMLTGQAKTVGRVNTRAREKQPARPRRRKGQFPFCSQKPHLAGTTLTSVSYPSDQTNNRTADSLEASIYQNRSRI